MTRRWTMRDATRVAALWLIGIAMATAAGAQGTEKISNHDPSATTPVTMGGSETARDQVAQAFTTGTHAMGYALEKIVLYMHDWPAATGDVDVSLHSESSGTIGTKLTDMTPSSTSTGLVDWTPDTATTLAQSTTYYVKVHNTTSGTGNSDWLRVRAIQGNAENSGGETGWSIADNRLDREGTGSWGSNHWSVQIAVHARNVTAPTVSIAAKHAKAMPELAHPAWTLTLTEAPATNLDVSLSFASSPTSVGNYLDAGASDTVTVPAGSTTADAEFPIGYTGTTSGTVTATVGTGTGYTVAASPNNAASVEVFNHATLLTVTTPAVNARTVNEGDEHDFSLTWSTQPGAPAPRTSVRWHVDTHYEAGGATPNIPAFDIHDYEQAIGGTRTVHPHLNTVELATTEWQPTTTAAGAVYSVTRNFTIITIEDTEIEFDKNIRMRLKAIYPDPDLRRDTYDGGGCGQSTAVEPETCN